MSYNYRNFEVIEKDDILIKQKKDKDMMNLHNKRFMELNKDELKREIDYLWGQYDFVSQCEELPKEYRVKKAKYIWDQLDVMTTRFISLSIRHMAESGDK